MQRKADKRAGTAFSPTLLQRHTARCCWGETEAQEGGWPLSRPASCVGNKALESDCSLQQETSKAAPRWAGRPWLQHSGTYRNGGCGERACHGQHIAVRWTAIAILPVFQPASSAGTFMTMLGVDPVSCHQNQGQL